MTQEPKTAGVIAPPPLLLLASLIMGWLLGLAIPLGLLSGLPSAFRHVAGGALGAGAFVLAFLAVSKFRAAKTPVNPYVPPAQLVTSGVFAAMRNPMYVAFYVLSLGVALAFALDWLLVTTAALALTIHHFVVKREERFLGRKFGEPYIAYRRKVRRYGIV